MKYASIFVIFLTVLIAASGSAFAQNIIDDSESPQYLFTLAGNSGTFEGDVLTMKGVPLVVYFTDRPVRRAGHLSLEKFVGLWDKGLDDFKNNPPNAELAIYEQNGDKHAIIILGHPVSNGNTVSFKTKVIGEEIPESFGHVTLFIDSLGMIFPSNRN